MKSNPEPPYRNIFWLLALIIGPPWCSARLVSAFQNLEMMDANVRESYNRR